jgi:hypothetical protein
MQTNYLGLLVRKEFLKNVLKRFRKIIKNKKKNKNSTFKSKVHSFAKSESIDKSVVIVG